ncbi:hypothetical protein Tco_1078925 [Tanacetum coccineum]|uniref:Uncharacterized protein n=1 Tax=Tanacetum coccineum TaxID=301880 RepID=A0ABQ5HQW0_9ASTR
MYPLLCDSKSRRKVLLLSCLASKSPGSAGASYAQGQGHAEYAGLDDVVGDNRLLDYSYAVVWDMSFQVVAAMFDKLDLSDANIWLFPIMRQKTYPEHHSIVGEILTFRFVKASLLALKLTIVGVPAHQVPLLLGLTASRAEPQLQHPGKHPDTGRALFM